MSKPWYKEFGIWILITPLIFVVFICSVLIFFAVVGSDDRITDDYYKEGKMINNRFAAETLARQYAIRADINVNLNANLVDVHLLGEAPSVEALSLAFSHPAKAGLDSVLTLQRISGSKYRGKLESELTGRWYIRLEPVIDNNKRDKWRLAGENDFRARSSFSLQ